MKPDELYKAILRAITQVRNVRAEREGRNGYSTTNVFATDSLLDEMARNAAQVVVLSGPLVEPEQAGPDNSGEEW